MAVPANVIVAWPSTAASIPAGWTRETNLDAKYVQGAPPGADADLTTARGSASHAHTSPSHTPGQDSHTHTFASSGGSSGSVNTHAGGAGNAADLHDHLSATSDPATATNNGVAVTVDVAANDLAFKEVIYIKSDGSPVGIPVGAYAFFASDTLPSGWGSRILGDTYLKGAASAGNGGATGGSNSHTHTSPAHTHTQNAHNHTGTSGGPTTVDGANAASTNTAGPAHTHAVTLDGATAVNQSVTTTISTNAHDPVFRKLNVIANGNASADLPTLIIAIWGGANASVPSGWTRFTNMDGNFLKGANAAGESDVTAGGSLTHTHTAANCQPVQNSHAHSITDFGPTGSAKRTTTTPATVVAALAHSHASWDCDARTATNQSVAVTVDVSASEAAYPPYARVIFIQFTGSAPPPVVHLGGYTSYDVGRFDVGGPEARKTPEVAAQIMRGDQRYMRE